jgi:multidrug transporter EmrE-like cation transporter
MTTWSVFAMIVFSVSCSAIAQILLKYGMAHPAMQQALAGGDYWVIARSIGTDAPILGGFLLYGLGAVIWLFVLAKLDVSIAYPFVALGFLLTMALGCLVFGEALTVRKVMGTLVVAFGIYLVATTK